MAKKTAAQRLMSQVGIFPLAPAKLIRAGAYLNAVSSVIFGVDIYEPSTGAWKTNAQLRAGERTNLFKRYGPGGAGVNDTFQERVRVIGNAWMNQGLSTITSVKGFQRTVAPVVITEIVYNVAKGTKVNNMIPPAIRKFVKVY